MGGTGRGYVDELCAPLTTLAGMAASLSERHRRMSLDDLRDAVAALDEQAVQLLRILGADAREA